MPVFSFPLDSCLTTVCWEKKCPAIRNQRLSEKITATPVEPPQMKEWKFYCDPETLERLRDSPAFHRLLDLARHTNALKYGVAAMYADRKSDTPWAARQRSATFFYHAGILFEAFNLFPSCGLSSHTTQRGRVGSKSLAMMPPSRSDYAWWRSSHVA